MQLALEDPTAMRRVTALVLHTHLNDRDGMRSVVAELEDAGPDAILSALFSTATLAVSLLEQTCEDPAETLREMGIA